jgi:SulP family sulfate permease
VGATAFSAVAISIEFCVLIGVFMSFLLTVPRAGRMLLTEFVLTPDGGLHERLREDGPCSRILIFGLEGEMFFGATAALEGHFRYIEERVDAETRVVVLRVKRARNPDAVGLALLDGFLERLKARGVHVLLCGVRPDFAEKIARTGLAERLGERLFLEQPVRQTSTLLAIRHAYELLKGDLCPTCPRRGPNVAEQPLHYHI